MKPTWMQLVDFVRNVPNYLLAAYALLGGLVPLAEYLFPKNGAEGRGPEKRAYVLMQASGLLRDKVHPFFGSVAGQAVLGFLIDSLVAMMNQEGAPGNSPASSPL